MWRKQSKIKVHITCEQDIFIVRHFQSSCKCSSWTNAGGTSWLFRPIFLIRDRVHLWIFQKKKVCCVDLILVFHVCFSFFSLFLHYVCVYVVYSMLIVFQKLISQWSKVRVKSTEPKMPKVVQNLIVNRFTKPSPQLPLVRQNRKPLPKLTPLDEPVLSCRTVPAAQTNSNVLREPVFTLGNHPMSVVLIVVS